MRKILVLIMAVMVIFLLVTCSSEKVTDSDEEELGKTIEAGEESEPADPALEEETSVENEEKNEAEPESAEPAAGMRPEFKEAMDSYEAFYDEYCNFMVKYKENPTDMQLITEYTDMMQRIVDMDEKFKAWENSDLNDEELKYYIEVSGRITQKMLDAAS